MGRCPPQRPSLAFAACSVIIKRNTGGRWSQNVLLNRPTSTAEPVTAPGMHAARIFAQHKQLLGHHSITSSAATHARLEIDACRGDQP